MVRHRHNVVSPTTRLIAGMKQKMAKIGTWEVQSPVNSSCITIRTGRRVQLTKEKGKQGLQANQFAYFPH